MFSIHARHAARYSAGALRRNGFAASLHPWRGLAASTAPTAAPSASDIAGQAAPALPPAKQSDSLLKIYAELSKARLSSLVVFTSGAGFLLAGVPVDWATCAATVTGTSLAAAAANTFNQVYERNTDKLMKRTQFRPLPSGRISVGHAVAFGLATTAASTGLLLVGANPVTAALGLANIALYAGVYTPMKQMSPLNTGVGAVVGAIPPLMGWAAATGGSLAAVDPVLLAYILFAWQFPHFYSLAWTLRKDYARGGHAMVPVFDATGKKTASLALRHTIGLAAVPLISSALGVTNPMFAVEGVVINGYLLNLARRFYADPHDGTARPLFKASLWYLPLLLILMVFHSKHWHTAPATAEQGEEATAARGLTWGQAVEQGVACARAAGRAVCAHDVILDAKVTSMSRAIQDAAAAAGFVQLFASSESAAAEAHGAEAEGVASTSSTDAASASVSGAAGSTAEPRVPASIVAAAESVARANTRAQCPVAVLEDRGSELVNSVGRVGVGVASSAASSSEAAAAVR